MLKGMIFILFSCLAFVVGDDEIDKLFKAYCKYDDIATLSKCVMSQADEKVKEKGFECVHEVNPELNVEDEVKKRDFFCEEATEEEIDTYKSCLHEKVDDSVAMFKSIKVMKECMGL